MTHTVAGHRMTMRNAPSVQAAGSQREQSLAIHGNLLPRSASVATNWRTLRLLDLFAGCGGLTQGFVESGRYRPVGAVEMDLDAAATYACNFGEHVAQRDIRSWRLGSLPLAEVVVGGPPCQGFSHLGARRADDPRNELWQDYVDVVRRVRPAFFVLENVPGFVSTPQFRLLMAETAPGGALSQWTLECHVLDASWYEVPQARRRALVLGRPKGMRPLGPPPPASRRSVVEDALRDLPQSVDAVEAPGRSAHVLGTDVNGTFTTQELHLTVRASDINRRRWAAVPPGGARRDLPDDLQLPAWRKGPAGAHDVMGRLRWDRPATTIRTEFFRPEKGRFLHPEEPRPITHREAALLQGFPETYRWCGSKASIARQIGNAVPVGLARALAHHVANHASR